MRVKLLTEGSNEHGRVPAGDTIEVDEARGYWLIAHGLAEAAGDAAPESGALQGGPETATAPKPRPRGPGA